ncbi:DUF3656 domain-containing U32 family peptidase [Wukongibacter sp. M2B1]|uniref:DUF3656 domain-containing U32 family peptidase n=1 Tax=Wukongibacter sp. M2B1 TaxID=3088895 RepID=UPI003D7C09F9
MKKVELLAPVGSYEALVAAVQNGADAVYLGGKKFGARQYANNFDEEKLKEAVEYCHIRGVKVYLTVNTIVADEELNDFMEYINLLYNLDVDAVIIQDLGVLKYIRESFPDFEVHASTQMTIHNLEGINLLKKLGVKRTVLAREMDLNSIRHIKENSDMEIEVFVHGALCICYSGQCLMSSLIGGRSGNRGRCAQPCRLPYKLVDLETQKEIDSPGGNYILSPKDLNTIENLDKLLEIGVESLKIEGRMKRPEYVAVVVRAYRKAIDMYYKKGKIKIDEYTKKELIQIFNRSFTKGHIFGEKGKELMGFEKPGNKGIEIGQVIGYDKKKRRLKIRLKDVLQNGDGIEVRNIRVENKGIRVRKILRNNKIVEKSFEGDIIEIEFNGEATKGDKVFKTADVELLKKASETYKNEGKKIPIFGAVKCKLGEELELYIWDNDNYITKRGKIKVEKAINKPLDAQRLEKQLRKLGNTAYNLEEVEIDIDPSVTIPISEVNSIRREAIDSLNKLRSNMNNRSKTDFRTIKLEYIMKKEKKNITSLTAYVNNIEQLRAVLSTDIYNIYYSNIYDLEKALSMGREAKKQLIPALNRITYDSELEFIRKKRNIIIENGHILVSNHGQLNMFIGEDIKIHTDFSFNTFNSLAVQKLRELNVSDITLSPELNYRQISDFTSKISNLEIIVYGHLPMMITEYCPVNAVLDRVDGEACNLCSNKKYGLKDRYGIVFPIQRDNGCRTHILNSKKMFLLENMDKIVHKNVKNMRLQFTNEDKNEIISIVNAYCKTLDRILKGKTGLSNDALEIISKYKDNGDYTKGHFLRGVM